MKRLIFLLLAGVLVQLSSADNYLQKMREDFEKRLTVHKLENGLTILFYERHDAPVVSVQTGFKVGSSDEKIGSLGGTHMLEHMLFKGSTIYGTTNYKEESRFEKHIEKWANKIDKEMRKPKPSKFKLQFYKKTLKAWQEKQSKYIVKNPYSPIFSANGAVGFNAYTSTDNTVYIINMPSNKLELWATLEAQRLYNPVFRSYYQERDVVNAERGMRTDSNPRGKMWEAFMSTAFKAHPYRNPIIGWKSEIEVLNKKSLQEFFSKYYVPNNCVITLVGDVYPEKTIPMLQKYFGKWKPAKEIPRTNIIEPEQLGEKYVKVEEKAQPFFYMGYHMPRENTKEGTALSLFSDILGKGRSSKLYKEIVVKQKIASAAFSASGVGGSRYPGVLLIGGYPKAPNTCQTVIKAMDKLLDEILEKGIEKKDLERLISAYKAEFIYALESNETIATILLRTQLNYGSWEEIFKGFELTLSITPEDIINAARKYIKRKNRTTAELVNVKKGK
jgi:predicted Zn-dependent peptidase